MSKGKVKSYGGAGGMSKHRKSGKTSKPQFLKVRINEEYIREQEEKRKLQESKKPKMFSKIKDLFRSKH